jgi:non-specific serine/threonine protein kinase/serine/threonine-protein kinase
MTPERWQQVKALLAAVLERSPAERPAFLDEVCGTDAGLRAEIESLIAYEEKPGGFIESRALDPDSELATLPTGSPVNESAVALPPEALAEPEGGRRIGPYRTVQQLGRGGMGLVYLAVRADDQYRKQVAIKLIRHGLDTDFVQRRFRTERQILAALDHPNIARLLDGGETEDGLPYLVMDYVEGVPIDKYCDQHNLTTEERLKLFQHVCGAVHYAHQHLIIHRDIKPSNILVTGEGQPKLLDFGIAKLLTPEIAFTTLDPTAPAVRLMTPAYASPEQVKGEPVTTTSDVYSLGVLLYELLTGHRPYRVKSQANHELMQAVLEEEPTKPSTVITLIEELPSADGSSRIAVTPESVSKTRGGSPERLRRRLRGDLDNILLTALRKDPQRRYASVEHFSEDIRRHLAGLPVRARKDTLAYRSVKFIKRHTASVSVAALVLVMLVVGFVEINRQRTRAERRFNDVRKLAHAVVFDYHDAIADLAGSTPVRQRLVKDALEYLDSLAKEAGDDQTLQRELAAAYRKIGDVQGNSRGPNLGDHGGALASYRKSRAICQALAEANPSNAEIRGELAESLEGIGHILWDMGDVKGTSEHFRQAMALLERLSSAAPGNAVLRRRLAQAYHNVGNIKGNIDHPNLGDTAGGLEYHRKALALRQALGAMDSANVDLRLDLESSHRTMANILVSLGNLAEAEPHARQSLAIAEALATADPKSVRVLQALGFARESFCRLLEKKGEEAQALECYRKMLADAQSMVALDPANVQARNYQAMSHTHLGDLLMKRGESAKALEQYRQAIAIDEATVANDPKNNEAQRNLAVSYQNIGDVLAQVGDLAGALRSQRQMVAIFEGLARKDPDNLRATLDLVLGYDQLSTTQFHMGNVTGSLGGFRQGALMGERALALDPANDRARRQLALRYFNIGELSAALATDANTATDQRSARWREARQAYQRSLDFFLDLRRKGVLPAQWAGKPDQITGKIARCDAALAK